MTPEELARRIAEIAVLRGTFTLRSGRASTYYIDKYLFLSQPDILAELAKMVAERLPKETTRLAGAELGGIPLVTAVSLACGLPCVFVRSTRKDHGTAKQIEGALEPHDKVVIVEDVATTGGQAIEAAKVLTTAGAEVLRIIATIDRQEGAGANIEAAGYAFEALFTAGDLGIDSAAD
ncbi:MAG: orotate phosphoribosyltransferase [Phycisphaerales bacterium]|nr:orotate phosphoribosyltransferase [Planctomycetota bacterium]MCZ6544025.1 orotate phosphoribosyltransferase [Planctomycetota bacterium]MCZ6735644.1 orotate phosphoribosyltransferase [Planctomycetota bacterium]MCZ6811515.1 orotate phosphoribosyltransferase [Planctomycetota bacterium]